ncbi:FtsK/SpoIIIE domain-containing protein [Neobacillus mesonae]|nr:DNA translocase FtsK [Neobacillus mesonae]MCM3569636.1 FtsK/SpoIIIE domain-containing protein [Neobacillus mesonae]
MSWIQNLFQKLKKDGEDEFEERFFHNDKTGDLSPPDDYVKDVDVKVSYQYPKGPSSSSMMFSKTTPREERPKSRKNSQAEKSSTNQSKMSSKEADPPKIKKEQPQPKIHGPFHPTEIPSPVFGFHRRKKSTAIVEHELSHFLQSEAESQQVIEEKAEKDIQMQTEQEAEKDIQMQTEQEAEKDIQMQTEQEAEKDIQMQTELEAAVTIAEQNKGISDVLTEALERAERDYDLENTYEEPVSHQEKTENKVDVLKEKNDEPFLKEENIEKRRSARSERSHLPFNVMMLKQDKQKWDWHKQTRRTKPNANEQKSLETQKETPTEQKPIPVAVQESSEEPIAVTVQESSEEPIAVAVQESSEEPIAVTVQESSEEPIPVTVQESSIEPIPVLVQESNVQQIKNVDGVKQSDDEAHYTFPDYGLLKPPVSKGKDTEWLDQQQELLNQTLQNFNVSAGVVNVTQGPAVTRFEVQPEPGVKVNKITNLSDDIKLSLAARDIRMEAPIPGKHTIGIEVPNQISRPVQISEIIQTRTFEESASPLTAVLGLDIAGKPIVTDLKKMPHGLIAGATGSGKSVCVNSILISLLYKALPEDLRLLLIDPKMVELAPYNRIPHLVSPVITDVKAATAALKWAVDEMERRYELFAHTGVRDISRFNELAMEHKQYSDKLPYIVIIIDELADLMMMSPADVEEAICRIAQKARACGIHLIIATQRPSVDVITGLIKANIPTRIAFSVSSQVDSRTIIDISGAEKLLGRGDMLFLENGSSKPIRLQGTFVSDEEIDLVVGHVREQQAPDYLFEQEELLKKAQVTEEEDELFFEACEFIVDQGVASTSSLQRRFKIGYNRAARLMDSFEQNGYITSANGSKPREVLISESDLEAIQEASYNV